MTTTQKIENILDMRPADWPEEYAALQKLINETVIAELEAVRPWLLKGLTETYLIDRIKQLKEA